MSDKSLSAHRPTPVARPMRFRAPRCTSYVLRRRVANGGMPQATGNARAHGCVIHTRLRGPRRHAVVPAELSHRKHLAHVMSWLN
jgi:hypothetical protein